ncbi:MAG: response regulator transcription factor [Lachnospiraceae bacterium]|nr:response regulator transcription factor [Lachnospiraceae bacterium]
MATLTVALVDDDINELSASRLQIEHWQSGTVHLSSFSSARELIYSLEVGERYDLYLLDVIMPEMDGITLGRTIRERDRDGAIVFLTSSPDFALQSYEVWPLQYLLKPINTEKLWQALDRAAVGKNKREEGVLVHTRSGDTFLHFHDILYAERISRMIRYICRSGVVESVTLIGSFREAVESLLEDDRFVLCGASFAVNLAELSLVDKTGAVMSTGIRLEMPRRAVSALRSSWMAYCLGERINE